MAGTLTVDTIQSDSSYVSTLNVASKINFAGGMQIGGQDATFGNRNRIINGAMVINQRAGDPYTASSNPYTLDRWQAYGNPASKYTVQQNAGSVTPPVGFSKYLGVTSSSAYTVTSTDYFFLMQKIEGYNVADLAWGTANAQTVTLSFWVRSSLTGTFGGSLTQGTTFGTSYPFTYTISSANTWEQKSVTIAGPTTGSWPTDNTGGVAVAFGLGNGSTVSGTAGSWSNNQYFSATGATSVVGTNGATFYITGVQLEKGSTATSFDYRPYGTEYALCQRYYQNLGNVGCVGYGTQGVTLPVIWPVEFRATPSVSISYSGTANRLYRFQSGGTADITPTIFATNKTITSLYYLSGTWAVGLGEGWQTAIVGSAEL